MQGKREAVAGSGDGLRAGSDLKPPQSLTRRSFLLTTAAAAGVMTSSGVLSSCSSIGANTALATGEDVITHHTCRGNCMNACHLTVQTRDGKMVRTSVYDNPDYPEYNRVCLKGLSHVEMTYNPDRIKYPMKRKSWSPDNFTPELRNADEWEQISWDEAIDIITTKWKADFDAYGTSSLVWWGLTGTYSAVNGAMGGYTRLRAGIGPTNVTSPIDLNVINGSGACIGAATAHTCNAHADMLNSKTMVIWGGNPTESQPQAWHFMAEAVDKGATLVVIDPTFNASASKAHYWLNIRPGSDAYLACAMSKYIIDNDLADIGFLKASTVAPFLLKADGKFLRLSDTRALEGAAEAAAAQEAADKAAAAGAADAEALAAKAAELAAAAEPDTYYVVDATDGKMKVVEEAADPDLHGTTTFEGKKITTVYDQMLERFEQYTLESAEEVCQIPADTIATVAELYATNGPAWIYMGFGIDRWMNGWASIMSIEALTMVAGQLGKPGASCGFSWYVGGEWRNWAFPSMVAGWSKDNVPGPDVSALQIAQFVKNKKFVDREFPAVTNLFVNNCDPLNSICDRNLLIENIFRTMELIVVVDSRMTDGAMYADILLPCSSWFEEEDLYGCLGFTPFVTLCEKAIEPLYESKIDYDICKLLAEGLGRNDIFGDMDSIEFLKNQLLPADYQMGVYDPPITYERLKENDGLLTFSDPYFVHGAGGVFPTATGRAQMYVEDYVPAQVVDISYGAKPFTNEDRWPGFVPPDEAWVETVGGYEANPLAEKYPLICYQEHTRYRVHSTFSHVPLLRELDPEPPIKINPVDAEARGIKNHDYVRAYNDRGECVAKAIVTEAQRPGQVNIPKGWHEDQYVKGHYQALTHNSCKEVCHNTGYFDILVEVEPYREEG